MGDYTQYIAATYGISAFAFIMLAVRSYVALKRSEKEVLALRNARKHQDDT